MPHCHESALALPEPPNGKEPNADEDQRRNDPREEIAHERTFNHAAERDVVRVELLDQIRIFNPNGRKQLLLLGSSFRFQLPAYPLMGDRDLRHFAGHHECPEFAVRKLFDFLHGHDEIVHKNDRKNREEDIPDRKGDFFVYLHNGYFLSVPYV